MVSRLSKKHVNEKLTVQDPTGILQPKADTREPAAPSVNGAPSETQQKEAQPLAVDVLVFPPRKLTGVPSGVGLFGGV